VARRRVHHRRSWIGEASTTKEQRPGASARLSAGTRQRLDLELAELRARRRELQEAVSDTDGVQDRGDQAQRLERADDLSRISDRIREIMELLTGRVRSSSEDALPEGTEVTVRFSDGTTDTMKVVTIPEEAPDALGALTRDSPLGRALVGARAGDMIAYRGPDGEIVAEVVELRMPTE
jgi:transcription elongation factor GreA